MTGENKSIIQRTLAPEWLLKREGITQRQWRQRKRAELRAVILAIDRYRMGCAYCPSKLGEVGAIGEMLETMKRNNSVKNWGR